MSMRLRGDDGTALLLVPAAMLVIFALTAITVDCSNLLARKNELYGLATEASNDAVSSSINQMNIRRNNSDWRDGTFLFNNKVVRDTGEYALGRTLRYVFVGEFADGKYVNCIQASFYQDVPLIYGKMLPGNKSQFMGASTQACYFFD